MTALQTVLLFILTAVAEIGGCYAVYLWWRLGHSIWWLAPGLAMLFVFAWLLTLHPISGAGRVYAAYGGVYIVSALLWLWLVESRPPDRWDLLGGVICLTGAGLIYFGPR